MAGMNLTVNVNDKNLDSLIAKLQQLKREKDALTSQLVGTNQVVDPKLFTALSTQLQRVTKDFDVLATKLSKYVADQESVKRATDNSTDSLLNYIKKGAALAGVTFGITQIKNLGSEVINVRNEFQQLEIAFGTMLKSADKASSLMKDLSKFAAETPFGLQSAASGAKQLLAYGSTADTVIGELTMLGDVAAGTGQQIGDLVYLYGTLRTQGRAYLMDIRQFAGRGIPIYDELAKVLNTSKDKVNELVSAGKVGFPEVERAFKNMTTQGGLYGGLMEEQSKSIGGRMEALGDNISSIFNKIGKDSEGFIYGSIDGINSLVGNYEIVGKILMGLVATYGIATAAEKFHIAMMMVQATSTTTVTGAKAAQIVVTNALTAAQTRLNASMITNPYILAAAAIIALGASIYKIATATTEAEKAVNKFNEEAGNQIVELNGVFNAYKRANEGTEEKRKLLDIIKSKYGEYIKSLIDEKGRINDIEAAQRMANEALKESIALKIKNESITEVTSKEIKKQATALGELRNIIAKSEGDEVANMITSKVGEIFSDESNSTRNAALEARKYLKNAGVDLNERASMFGVSVSTVLNDLQASASNLKNEKKNIEDSFKGLIQGDPIDLYVPEKKADIPMYGAEYAKAKANWEETKKELQKIDKEKSQFTKKQYDDAVAAEKTAKEAFEKLGGKIKDNSKSTDSAAEKARKKGEDLKKATEKQYSENIRSAKDLEFQIADAEIKAMEEGSLKVLAQLDLNYAKEKEALKRQQEDALKTKKDNARAIFEADEKNKGKSFDDSSIKLEQSELDKYKQLEQKSNEIYAKDKLNIELQYMRDYISEYGSFQQRKLEIAKEYDKKIAAASSSWEKKILENQKQSAISAIDIEAINKKIDWQSVLGDFTGVMGDQLKELLSNLKEYIKTDQFKQLPVTDQKTVYDAIEKLRAVTPGGEGTLNFNEIKRQMSELGSAINRVQKAELRKVDTEAKLAKAREAYTKATESGSASMIEAKKAFDEAFDEDVKAGEDLNSANTDAKNLANGVKQSTQDTINGLNMVADGLSSFASGSLAQAFSGIQKTLTGLSKVDLGQTANQAIAKLVSSFGGEIGQIIGAVLSVLDVLKDGIGTLVSDLIDLVLNAVDGILKDILSFDIGLKIGNSLKEGLGNILNTISFGGFNSLVSSINGGNAKETAQIISRLTASNEALKMSVDALKDEMAGSNGSKSIDAYNDAVAAQERYTENLRKILDTQMRYSNSHHSNAYYWDLNPDSLKEINKTLGTNLSNSWADFATLTPDQLDKIRKHLPDIWSEMINQGKYGDRFADDWNNYADQAGKVGELTDELRENIAQISFDNLRDSFVNALMDMDKDAADFADNFEEYLTRALLNFAIGDLLDSRLKDWYNNWTNTMNEQGGKLTDDQIAQKKKEWDDIVADAIDIRDNITNSTGYTGKDSTKQEASKGYSASMSQDTGEKIEGRMTGMQMNLISIDQNIARIAQWNQPIEDKFEFNSIAKPITLLNESSLRIERMIEEIRNIAISSYYELKDINKNTQELHPMRVDLKKIEEHLSYL